jgi:hypothetical protein
MSMDSSKRERMSLKEAWLPTTIFVVSIIISSLSLWVDGYSELRTYGIILLLIGSVLLVRVMSRRLQNS